MGILLKIKDLFVTLLAICAVVLIVHCNTISKMASSLPKVFVYGTLKKGQPNHYWLTNTNNGFASYISNGTTKNKYPLVISTQYNIPFLLNKPGIGKNIKGEIYEINNEMLRKLDILEDYPELYDRQIEDILTKDGGTVSCWVYLLRNFPTKLIEKTHLEEYAETSDLPYLESYGNSTEPDDVFHTSEMASNLLRVFVYGTLKNGQPNHNCLTNATNGSAMFLATGRTKNLFPLVVGTPYNVPFLLNKPGTGRNIKGEIYDVDERMLAQLDILEDFPRLYDRQIQDIITNDGDIPCWIYLLKNFPEQLLDKEHLEEYKDSSEKPYIERSKRQSNIQARDFLF